jgi:UPF0042 nucleotide-binding protein
MELVIVTGLSGAGRRSVLSALEDSGCTAIDNVPVGLLGPLLELEAKLNPIRTRLAVGMDNRHLDFATEFSPLLDQLAENSIEFQVLFVEADDHTLMRRYSETRRPHFLAGSSTGLAEAFAKERAMLAPVRALATAVIDTSRLNLSQLRQRINELVPGLAGTETVLRLISFGFKFGLPEDADMVLDARFLPNPHYIQDLRPFTGCDQPVQEFLLKSDDFGSFLARIENWIRWAWPLILQEARAYHTIAIGCTGGQHRSVALVELLAKRIQRDIPNLQILHRELKTHKTA